MVVYSGRTVEQAIEKGLRDLNLPRMKAHIKVISREKKGCLLYTSPSPRDTR